MITAHIALYSLIGGLIPALIWLHFWLKEDTTHPEPRGRIIYTFILGALAVFFVYPFQLYANTHLIGESAILFALMASITEEPFKLGAAYLSGFKTRFYDEPIDAVVYMITAALGFSAMENIFYVLNPLIKGDTVETIVTGNLRFIGASLLHIVASGILGAFIGLGFYQNKPLKWVLGIIGLIIAIALHTFFDFFIIANNSQYALIVFSSIWVSIILLILLIERIKFIKKTN